MFDLYVLYSKGQKQSQDNQSIEVHIKHREREREIPVQKNFLSSPKRPHRFETDPASYSIGTGVLSRGKAATIPITMYSSG